MGGLQLVCGRPTLALSSEKINGGGAGRWGGDWVLASPAELQLTIRDTDRLSENKCSLYSKRYKSIQSGKQARVKRYEADMKLQLKLK